MFHFFVWKCSTTSFTFKWWLGGSSKSETVNFFELLSQTMPWSDLDHHAVIAETPVVRPGVPPRSKLDWLISVPGHLLQKRSNVYKTSCWSHQFSNSPSTSLSSLATQTYSEDCQLIRIWLSVWRSSLSLTFTLPYHHDHDHDDKDDDHDQIIIMITLRCHASSPFTFLRHSLAPRWFLRYEPLSPLS